MYFINTKGKRVKSCREVLQKTVLMAAKKIKKTKKCLKIMLDNNAMKKCDKARRYGQEKVRVRKSSTKILISQL